MKLNRNVKGKKNAKKGNGLQQDGVIVRQQNVEKKAEKRNEKYIDQYLSHIISVNSNPYNCQSYIDCISMLRYSASKTV